MKTFNEFIAESFSPEMDRLKSLGLATDADIARLRILRKAGPGGRILVPDEIQEDLTDRVRADFEQHYATNEAAVKALKRMGIDPTEIQIFADYGETSPARWLQEAINDSDLTVVKATAGTNGDPKFRLYWENGTVPNRLNRLLKKSYGLLDAYDQSFYPTAIIAYADWLESPDPEHEFFYFRIDQ